MTVDVVVPDLGESVAEATVAQWFKAPGDPVARDEVLLELETDKANLEIYAEAAGVLGEILVPADGAAAVGDVVGRIEEGAAEAPAAAPAPGAAAAEPEAAPALSPAVRRLVAEHALDPARISGTGKGGRILKGDVLRAAAEASPAADAAASPDPAPAPEPAPAGGRGERRVPMSRLRRTVAARLKQAQNTAAMLTTFNDVDMSAVMRVRAEYREAFEARHGARLGFMSFFVKAAAAALRELPELNAEIDGGDIVYRDYCDIGVAVGTPRGLVVPVLRGAERMGFAEIERAIGDFGRRARDGELAPADMRGGTFTISNGGVYGSLLSTPILNPPQSAILGMHRIDKRPVAVGDAVEVRPMMYLALSYDHRIVDGREAVTFLARIRERVEDPRRLMLDV